MVEEGAGESGGRRRRGVRAMTEGSLKGARCPICCLTRKTLIVKLGTMNNDTRASLGIHKDRPRAIRKGHPAFQGGRPAAIDTHSKSCCSEDILTGPPAHSA